MDLARYIRDIPDFPKPGIIFKDIAPLIGAPEAFGFVIDSLAERYANAALDGVLGIESRGFIFGGALAKALGVSFIPARKPGKLPYKTIAESYALEYGEATLEIHEDALRKGDRILVLDDLIATGGTLAAACALVERLGGEVAEICAVIELTFLNGREKLPGRTVHTMLQF